MAANHTNSFTLPLSLRIQKEERDTLAKEVWAGGHVFVTHTLSSPWGGRIVAVVCDLPKAPGERQERKKKRVVLLDKRRRNFDLQRKRERQRHMIAWLSADLRGLGDLENDNM